jgi:hypothetical protein
MSAVLQPLLSKSSICANKAKDQRDEGWGIEEALARLLLKYLRIRMTPAKHLVLGVVCHDGFVASMSQG